MMRNRRDPALLLLIIFAFTGRVDAQLDAAKDGPQPVQVVTKDGVQVIMNYFPGPENPGSPAAKQTTPVVLLHDYKDTRAVFNSLARRLQAPAEGPDERPPFAVISVDLRAHGDSTRQVLPNGEEQELDAARISPAMLAAMATLDMEAVRAWLVTKNDEGALNLNKLCLVGAGMGANVAANWAAQDWSAPPLAIGKQGQDVKALVLISPQWSYRGLSMQAPMRQLALKQNSAWMLLYGGDDQEARADIKRVYDQLSRLHPVGGAEGGSTLSSLSWPSALQGGKLLAQAGPAAEEQIVQFLTTHVASAEIPWLNRRDRLPAPR
jgi:pimeloyl-ACP methyl ester carboxylesterase